MIGIGLEFGLRLSGLIFDKNTTGQIAALLISWVVQFFQYNFTWSWKDARSLSISNGIWSAIAIGCNGSSHRQLTSLRKISAGIEILLLIARLATFDAQPKLDNVNSSTVANRRAITWHMCFFPKCLLFG